jgi:hypothetical protein
VGEDQDTKSSALQKRIGGFIRVTRSGEFSPMGRIFTSGWSFNHRGSPNFTDSLLHGDIVLIFTKMGWALFWVNFPQTHLVTLPFSPISETKALNFSREPILCMYDHRFHTNLQHRRCSQ